MKLSSIINTNESLNEDSGDHEYRGDFNSSREIDVATEDAAVEATNSILDSDSEYREIDDVDTGIGEAVNAVGQIGELAETVGSEEGVSLSPLEEQSVQASMESIFQSIGLRYTHPSQESLAGNSRRTELVASLESAMSSVFEKIIQAFKSTIENIINFLMNIFRNNWILLKYCDHVRKKLNALGSNDKASKKTMSESASAISCDGEANFKSVQKLGATARDMLTMTEQAIDKVNKINFKFDALDSTQMDKEFLINHLPRHEGIEKGFGYIVGDKAFISREMFASENKAYSGVRKYDQPAKESEVLNMADMKTTLDMAKIIISDIKKAESKKSILKNVVSRISQFTAQLASVYGGVVSKKAREFHDDIGYIRGYRSVLNSIVGRFPLEAFKTAKALIDYVKNSCKYYGSNVTESDEDKVYKADSEVVIDEDDEPRKPKVTSRFARSKKNADISDV